MNVFRMIIIRFIGRNSIFFFLKFVIEILSYFEKIYRSFSFYTFESNENKIVSIYFEIVVFSVCSNCLK